MSAYRVHPTSAPVMYCYGRWLAALGKPFGIELLERCVRMAPGLFDAQLALGRAYLDAGDADKALSPLRAAAMQHGEHPEVRELLAEASRQVAKARQQELDRLQARYVHGGELPALLAWTDALAEVGRVDDALAAFAREARRFDDRAAFHRAHAVALMWAGQRDRAIEAYRASLALAGDQADVLAELATALMDRDGPGDVAEAKMFVDRALRLSPNGTQVLIARAGLLERQGRRKEATAIYHGLRDRLEPGELRSMLEARLEILEPD